MRLGFLFLLLIAVIFGSGYWYTAFDNVCKLPVRYRIGEVDPRFGTDKDELRRIVATAEKVWEDKVGKELFLYDPGAPLPINLIFDERQENAEIEVELREDIEAKEGMSEEFAHQYDALIAEFRRIKRNYESRVVSYESKLGAYNETVAEWNEKGGAPEAVVEDLRETEAELKTEQRALESLAKELNRLVIQLNAIGARANTLITDYNTVVEEYNDRIAETGEFTQGDYTVDAITVYQFNSEDELIIVLAHEFGHALSLGHVPNEESIMYHLMESQSVEEGVTEEDVAEFMRVCSKKNAFAELFQALKNIF
jgi:predicted Zn-dependent protease